MSSEIIAAIFGALLAGGFQTIIGVLDRRREDEAILVAIASEVDALCRLIRHRNYLAEMGNMLVDLEIGTTKSLSYVVDIRSDYFSVFHALSSRLGRLKPGRAAQIVRFYAYCKTIIDSLRPDGVAAEQREALEAIELLRSLIALLTDSLELGDRIVQFPKRSLVELELPT